MLWRCFSTMKQTCYKKAAASINDHVKCKEVDFYVLKMIINSNSVVTANAMKTPHCLQGTIEMHRPRKDLTGQYPIGMGFIGCRRCTLTTNSVLTINEWVDFRVCVCVWVYRQRGNKKENETEDNVSKESNSQIPQAEESSCYIDLLLTRFLSISFLAEP